MAAKVEIIYEAEATSLKATVNEVTKANSEVVKDAQVSAQKVSDSFKEAGSNIANAFANQKIKTGLENLNKEIKQTSSIVVKSAQDVAKFEDRLRELSVAGKRNTDEFKDTAKAVGEYKAAIIAADRAVDLYAKSTDAATGRIGELEDKLYDLALAGKSNTKEFKDLVKEVATVRRAVIETDAQVDALAQRGAKLTGFVQSVELVGNAFQAVEGAAALFGKENEELQKTLVRLQAIMAITSAIEQGRVIITEQLAAKTGIAAVATKLYAAATAGATAATTAFRVAIAATGVGLLITGIALLVDKLRDAAFSQEQFNRALELTGQTASKTREAIKGIRDAQVDAANRVKLATGQITDAELERQEAIKEVQKASKESAKAEIGLQAQLIVNQRRLQAELKNGLKSFADEQAIKSQLAAIDSQLKASASRRKALETDTQTAIAGINDAFAKEEQAKRDEEAKKAAEDRAKQAKADAEAIAKAQLETFRNLLNETATLQKDFDKQVADERKKNEAKLQTDIADLADTSLQTQLDTRLAFLRTLEIEEGSSLDRRINIIELEGQKRQDAIRNSVADQTLANKLILEDEAKTQEAIRAERKKSADEQIELAFQVAQALADTFSSIIELQNIESQKRIENITAASEAEKLAIEQSKASEIDKQAQLDALRKRTESKIREEKTRQAKADKAAALFQAIIGTAAAVAKAATIPEKIIVGVAGAAQISIIGATPIPKFKKGGPVGGRSHEAGGTLIEAEKGEYVVNKTSVSQHRKALDAMNTSSAAFKKYIDEKYVRPAIAGYALNNKDRKIQVNASLNSKSMEKELKGLRRDMRNKNTVVNINGFDSRYAWHQN